MAPPTPTALGAPAVEDPPEDDRLALVVGTITVNTPMQAVAGAAGRPLDCGIEDLDIGRDRVLDDLVRRLVGGVAQLGDHGVAGSCGSPARAAVKAGLLAGETGLVTGVRSITRTPASS